MEQPSVIPGGQNIEYPYTKLIKFDEKKQLPSTVVNTGGSPIADFYQWAYYGMFGKYLSRVAIRKYLEKENKED